MVIAIYGGSFNPPHVGHGMVAAWLRWTGRADQVWLLPTYKHAFAKYLAPFELRCEMLEAMRARLPEGVQICRLEEELPTPSYTWNTLCALQATHPEHQFRLVIGADNLNVVDKWFRWDDIVETFSPIVVGRTGFPPVDDAPTFPEVSSTEIRRRLDAGEPIEHLVTTEVAALLKRAWGR